MLSIFLGLAAGILAPARCAACDVRVRAERVFCPICAATTVFASEEEGFAAAFLYGGAIARSITRFKYEGRSDLARPLSALLRRVAPRLGATGIELVIPVPLHPLRLAERGYNQAALLARPLARDLGASFAPLALRRTRDTAQQATLARADRLRNVENVFAVREPRAIEGRRVLLVDDVRTTGATLRECMRVVMSAGARDVSAAALAIAPI
jgi:ComF family protein